VKDYYQILEIDPTATPEDIKKSFRSLSKKYHPDKTKNDKEAEEKFKLINEAYTVLSDAPKRQKYDMQRQYGESGANEALAGMFREF
jgi:curved DNA-binding protein CbpA